MVQLSNFKNSTATKIEDNDQPTEMRPYLGMSKIGHSCERYLWYSFRWCYNKMLPARMVRLFNRGHLEEIRFINELERIGVRCYGDQTEVIMAHGHSKGHCDGMCIGVVEAPKTEHLLEFKTMADKYFKEVVKKGVKSSKPVYYAQTQIYMSKLKLTRALFGAVNKNDDSLYWERIKLDSGFADDLERKAERVVLSEIPPERPFKSTWFECRFCDAKSVCHENAEIYKTCRTCESMDILPEGQWSCSKYDLTLVTAQQLVPCKFYKMIDIGE